MAFTGPERQGDATPSSLKFLRESFAKKPTSCSLVRHSEVLPSSDRPFVPMPVIEIMGLPWSGKTSLIAEVRFFLQETLPDSEIISDYNFEDSQRIREIRSRRNEETSLHKEGYYFGLLKLAELYKTFEEMLKTPKETEGPRFTLIEQGPNDVLAKERGLIMLEPNKRVLPGDGRLDLDDDGPVVVDYRFSTSEGDLVERARLLAYSAGLACIPDGIVFCSVSLETAMERRKAVGLKEEGFFVSSKVWPNLIEGYNWWLDYVYPWLWENFGTGLLVVDGEKTIEENAQAMARFISKCYRSTE